ncbi:hypothetical protein AB0J68_00160 [Micromonospora sp. NPDC049580]|uniref:hypothetical protein n=1 Tax=Micromonospora sp. NPDC049580 TaxID=3154832 RepID=UPI00342117A2
MTTPEQLTTPAELVARWLRLVAADAELSPYLIGVDLGRLAAHLATVLDGEATGWCGLGWSEAQHRRVLDYLEGVLRAAELPDGRIARVRRAFEVAA